MLIFTSGISGSGRKEFLKKFEDYARRKGKKVKIYRVGEMLFEYAKKIGVNLTKENILNASPSVITSIKGAVFEVINKQIDKDLKENDVVIINIHAIFFWKKVFSRAWDHCHVKQFKVDMFISFIDKSVYVHERLVGREQWEQSSLSIDDILFWQNVEVEMTASWAEIYDKPHYVIAISGLIETFYRLIFEPNTEKVYISMPITDMLDKKEQKKVDKFIEKLNEHFIVFDPRDTELLTKEQVMTMDPVSYNQIVLKDLYWLLAQSDRIIAWFPKVILSAGVVNELREAHDTNKKVWLVYPKDVAISPFLTYFCKRIFRDPKDLYKYMDKKFKKALRQDPGQVPSACSGQVKTKKKNSKKNLRQAPLNSVRGKQGKKGTKKNLRQAQAKKSKPKKTAKKKTHKSKTNHIS